MELRAIVEEQTALRRVAMLVAVGAEPGAVFAAVAEEVGQAAAGSRLRDGGRYDGTARSRWSAAGAGRRPRADGRRVELGGRNVSTLVYETGQSARGR